MIRLVFVLVLVLAGCAGFQNTLAQDLAWERWKQCDTIPGVTLKEIRTNGDIWVLYTDNLGTWQECDRNAKQAQAARGAVVVPSHTAAAVAPSSGPWPQPVWKVGNEWAYRWETPDGAGTFVWSVDRIEAVNGEPHYVISTGTMELFYRVRDLGFTREFLNGKLSREITPSDWRFISFPLAPGTSWDMKWHEVRAAVRQTEDVQRRCAAEAHETVTVPAGTFPTMRVVCTNTKSGAWVVTVWYAPQVGHIVREETAVTGGKRVREMISYRLR